MRMEVTACMLGAHGSIIVRETTRGQVARGGAQVVVLPPHELVPKGQQSCVRENTTCPPPPAPCPLPFGGPMQAAMQDFPLTLHHIVWRVGKLFPQKQIGAKRANGLHRYTYGALAARARKLAAALTRIG